MWVPKYHEIVLLDVSNVNYSRNTYLVNLKQDVFQNHNEAIYQSS